MANNLDLSATLKLIDDITAPLRGIQNQVERSVDAFDDARNAVRSLHQQQSRLGAFSAMRSELSETSEQLNRARGRMDEFRRQIAATQNPTQSLINQFDRAERAVNQLSRRFDSQSNQVAEARRRLESAGISTQNLASEQRRLADSIEQANRRLGQQRDRLGRVRQAQQQAAAMGDMRNKAVGLAAGGVAATYAGAQLIKPGLEFEEAMSRLQALTKLDKSSPQLKVLKEQAQMLGASTQFTQADAARGQAFLAMAGFTPESIKAAMPGMLDLALAGDMELPQVADIASNILSGMNLDPNQMGNVADVLSGAFTRANLDVAMLGETMKYAAPGAASLGVGLEELAAMAGKLGDAGIQASESGTAIRAIMQRLAGLPAPVKKALNKIGVETKDAHGNLKPVTEILEEIYAKTENLGTADRSALLTQIAGMNASGAMEKLVQYAGSGELQELTEKLQNTDGEAANLAKTMSDNTIGDFKAAMSATDALRTSLYEANKDGIRAFIQGVTELVQKLTTWAQAHPELVSLLGKVFGLLAIGAVLLGTFGAVLLTILGPMALLKASLATLGLPSYLTPLGLLAKGFKALSTALTILRAAAAAHPILALIMVLATLAYVVYKNWDTLGPMFMRLWDAIGNGAQRLWQWLTSIWASIKQSIVSYATQLWSDLGVKFNSGIMALANIILAFSPVGLFIRVFVAVWSYFSGLGSKFYQYGANLLTGLKNGIMSKANAVVEGIRGVAGKIKGAFTGLMGIHSPSRVFAGYGDFMMQGLDQGLRANNAPVNAMLQTSRNLRQAMDTSAIRFDTRKPIRANMANAVASGSGANVPNITINVYAQPNHSEQDIARMVAEQINRTQSKANNNALYDHAEDW